MTRNVGACGDVTCESEGGGTRTHDLHYKEGNASSGFPANLGFYRADPPTRLALKLRNATPKAQPKRNAKGREVPIVRPRSPWLYVVQAQPSGNLKIGRATSVESRLIGLRVGTWETLTVLCQVCAFTNEPEEELHARWSEHRIRGEWFRPAPDIMAWVAVHRDRLERQRRKVEARREANARRAAAIAAAQAGVR
jgi:hypothetical protein